MYRYICFPISLTFQFLMFHDWMRNVVLHPLWIIAAKSEIWFGLHWCFEKLYIYQNVSRKVFWVIYYIDVNYKLIELIKRIAYVDNNIRVPKYKIESNLLTRTYKGYNWMDIKAVRLQLSQSCRPYVKLFISTSSIIWCGEIAGKVHSEEWKK